MELGELKRRSKTFLVQFFGRLLHPRRSRNEDDNLCSEQLDTSHSHDYFEDFNTGLVNASPGPVSGRSRSPTNSVDSAEIERWRFKREAPSSSNVTHLSNNVLVSPSLRLINSLHTPSAGYLGSTRLSISPIPEGLQPPPRHRKLVKPRPQQRKSCLVPVISHSEWIEPSKWAEISISAHSLILRHGRDNIFFEATPPYVQDPLEEQSNALRPCIGQQDQSFQSPNTSVTKDSMWSSTISLSDWPLPPTCTGFQTMTSNPVPPLETSI